VADGVGTGAEIKGADCTVINGAAFAPAMPHAQSNRHIDTEIMQPAALFTLMDYSPGNIDI
jgi:hypothetical protein